MSATASQGAAAAAAGGSGGGRGDGNDEFKNKSPQELMAELMKVLSDIEEELDDNYVQLFMDRPYNRRAPTTFRRYMAAVLRYIERFTHPMLVHWLRIVIQRRRNMKQKFRNGQTPRENKKK